MIIGDRELHTFTLLTISFTEVCCGDHRISYLALMWLSSTCLVVIIVKDNQITTKL